MDASTVYTLIIKLASSGGTVYALASCAACLLLTAILGFKFYTVNKQDREKRDANTELEIAINSGDANRVKLAVRRLQNLK